MEVVFTKRAVKQLRKVPKHIAENLRVWVDLVTRSGIEEARKIPGYHDEPLKGDREGQRSIRLSRAYRAIYESCEWEAEADDESNKGSGSLVIEFISVEEVNKHDY